MNKIAFILRYINYLLRAKSRYRIHSQFVYEFVNDVLKNNHHYDIYNKLWELRQQQAASNDTIETVDFGSGAKGKPYQTKISNLGNLVKLRSHSKSRLELLHRITRKYKPQNILEFGTATGISSSYLKTGSPDSYMITMEGCANLASKAEELFRKLEVDNLEIAIGNFEKVLDESLNKFKTLDFVFFDGNHRMDPTLRYFKSCAELTNENTIFVFDDIHWSKGMEKAWEKIKIDNRVSISIDLFWFGIVFFRKGIEKQDFIIRY